MDKRRILVEQLHPKSAIPEKIMMSCLPSSPKGTMDRQDQVPHNIMEPNHSWNSPNTFYSHLSWRIDPILHQREKGIGFFTTSGDPMSHECSGLSWVACLDWQMGNFTNLFFLLGKGWHSCIASESFNFPHVVHKRREMHKDMILLQKKYSPMHNAQCACKGYLPLRPKRFLSCWIMNRITFFEVTVLILYICLSIVKNNSFIIFL